MKNTIKYLMSFAIVALGITASIKVVADQSYAVEDNLGNNNITLEEEDSCTVMYVGKAVSENGLPIVARTGDGRNSLIYHNVKVYQENELANKVMKGKNGFTWDMPSHTYRFTGFPRSKSVDTAEYWSVSTMNQEGLAVSATLSCFSDEDRILEHDPLIETGISEDNIAALLTATCKTARESMEYLAHVIDTKGSAEGNIVISVDQNEAWLMEIYSGHEYCAIKLPDDKATTIGNEFFLNTLVDIDDSNIIKSPRLFSLPKEKGFAVYEGGSEDKNMNLFLTYARPLTYDAVKTDGCHMRTWRGRDLFAVDEERADYESTLKYASFFTPKRKLNINDFFTYFRDSYENLLENPDPKYDIFRQRDKDGKLRSVATETSYQVHVMMVHPDFPKEMAVEAWICMGNATGAPFVPFNNSMNVFPEEYTHEIKNYGADEKSALYLFRRVSAIANIHKKEYALQVQKFWNIFEEIWHKQYDLCLAKAKELIANKNNEDAKRLLNNYLFDTQTRALTETKYLYEDLVATFIEEQKSSNQEINDFEPKTNILSFADLYGYYHQVRGTMITLTKGNKTVNINFENLDSQIDATIESEGKSDFLAMRLANNNYYGDLLVLNEFIAKNTELKELDYKELMSRTKKTNIAPIVVGSVLGTLLIAAGAIVIVISVRKRKESKTDSELGN